MQKKKIIFWMLLAAALLLGGCSMRTIDQMYMLPKRSDGYNSLQAAIDSAMADMEYCAPLTGENRQTVHMADLDGDGDQDYLLFAKCNQENPLRILIFCQIDGQYVHTDTVESAGSAFEQVEYVQMDESNGLEIVVGTRLSDELLCAVSVYTFRNGAAEQLVSANYTRFLTVDLDKDNLRELFILRPGQTETDKGLAELYDIKNGVMERVNQVDISVPADDLKRVFAGTLHGGEAAVYVAGTEAAELITDIYSYTGGKLVNVCRLNNLDTGIKTAQNHYIYARDIDDDGVVELPSVVFMPPTEEELVGTRQDLIRWYTVKADGTVVNKCYTYHNPSGGWYMEIDGRLAAQATVIRQANTYECFVWDDNFEEAYSVFCVFVFTGNDRNHQSVADGRFVLYKTDSVTYAAQIGSSAFDYEITQESLAQAFHLIYNDWKTGEA